MRSLEELLKGSIALHGNLCPGQVIGVRMAMRGCRELGIDEPKGYRNLIVYIEIDRCATDAIQSVTGCKLGKRTLKHVDYGKMAATFVDLASKRAVRVIAREEARDLVPQYVPPGLDKYSSQVEAYKIMSEEELLEVQEVTVQIPPQDMPGSPISRIICDECGEGVVDKREVVDANRTLCRACAGEAYYHVL